MLLQGPSVPMRHLHTAKGLPTYGVTPNNPQPATRKPLTKLFERALEDHPYADRASSWIRREADLVTG
jgi:hypothetical protein